MGTGVLRPKLVLDRVRLADPTFRVAVRRDGVELLADRWFVRVRLRVDPASGVLVRY